MRDIERVLALAEPRKTLSFEQYSREITDEVMLSKFTTTLLAKSPYALELAQMRNVITLPALHDAVRRVLNAEPKPAA